MDGERLAVEQVSGPTNNLKPVYEAEASLLVVEIDGKHSPGCRSELLLSKVVEWIVGKSHIINLSNSFHISQSLAKT